MASAKKKPSAKRTVKYAAKTQSTATHAAVKAATNEIKSGSYWAEKSAAQWQKNAADWMNQSSKMLPFPKSMQQPDMAEAGKKAADTMKSATESAMKMGSELMSQLFGQSGAAMPDMKSFMPQMPAMQGFDANGAQEKMTSFARESAEQMQKSASSANRATAEAMELSRENAEALVQVTNIAVTVSKEVTAELISYLNKLFSQNVELSKQVLSCRTLNDMFDLSGRMVKTNLDGFFSESVKLSELLFQSANEISEPLNERVSETTERLNKALAA